MPHLHLHVQIRRTQHYSVLQSGYLRTAVSSNFCQEILAGGQSIQGGSHELSECAELCAADRCSCLANALQIQCILVKVKDEAC